MLPVVTGQPTLSFDLKKPKKYEERQLRSEKTGEKKFTFPRKAYQNTVTHYNWYFNANNRLNEVLDRAKSFHQDDYSQLLPFYNYSLEITQKDSMELDSVIYKSNAGILIHDLRNAWIDNLYMLMGKAYFFKNQLDSAYLSFQYINFAFSPKEKDGYDKTIGSNANEGGSAFSISTKEDNSLLKKAVSTPPSRNESFIWQIRTFLERGELVDAAVMIQTLKKDPVFPSRLHNDLHEVESYYFYKQQLYDSAAHYLELALGNASNKYELSRWEYLLGQLYERAGKSGKAEEFFARAIKHSLDPVLEVYARLNSIRQNKGDDAAIQRNIDELAKMGRRDRYSRYRDIIYYMAAQIEMERNNIEGAKYFLLMAANASTPESVNSQRSKAYLLLGDLSFKEKKYLVAKSYYDSIGSGDPVILDPPAFDARLQTLGEITSNTWVITRQDSLQHLASLPEDVREALLKKRVKQLKKLYGIKDEEPPVSKSVLIDQKNQPPVDLFNNTEKGEWYFYNSSLKSKGYSAFVSKWGKRPNVDNWRRLSAVDGSGMQQAGDDENMPGTIPSDITVNPTYEALLAAIPLTPEQLAASNDSIENAKVDLSRALFNGLEDYHEVIQVLDSFPVQYPNSTRLPEALYFLYVSHQKTGNTARARQLLDTMQLKFAGNPMERQMTMSVSGKTVINEKEEMTKRYEQIYTLFIEGNFEEALKQKKLADEIYGQNYWTPQLLYIQSIYFIRQRQDQEAKNTLASLAELFRESPMAEKAQNLLDVLNRRREIEDYLTKLDIKRPTEDEPVAIDNQPAKPVIQQNQVQPSDTLVSVQQDMQKDSLTVKNDLPTVTNPAEPVEKNPEPVVEKPKEEVVKPKEEVVKQETKKEPTPAKIQEKPKEVEHPVIVKTDSVRADKTLEVPKTYSHNPDQQHYVVMVTDKVDPVYITESRNAFNRFNQQRHPSLQTLNQPLTNDLKFLVISGFNNASEAQEYSKEIKRVARTQIIPWLPANKYFFITISNSNYELLLKAKTLEEYKEFESRFFKD